MDKPLHARKIEILSRLVKADQITLDEALLLLKDESPEENQVVTTPFPTTYPGLAPYWYNTPSVLHRSSGTVPADLDTITTSNIPSLTN